MSHEHPHLLLDLKLKASVDLRKAINPLAKARVFRIFWEGLTISRLSPVKMVNRITRIIRIMDEVRIVKWITLFIN